MNINADIKNIITNILLDEESSYCLLMLSHVNKEWRRLIARQYKLVSIYTFDRCYLRVRASDNINNVADMVAPMEYEDVTGIIHSGIICKIIKEKLLDCLTWLIDFCRASTNLHYNSTLYARSSDTEILNYLNLFYSSYYIKYCKFRSDVIYTMFKYFGEDFVDLIAQSIDCHVDWDSMLISVIYSDVTQSMASGKIVLTNIMYTSNYPNGLEPRSIYRPGRYSESSEENNMLCTLIGRGKCIKQIHYNICIDLDLVTELHIIYDKLVSKTYTACQYSARRENSVTSRILRSPKCGVYLLLRERCDCINDLVKAINRTDWGCNHWMIIGNLQYTLEFLGMENMTNQSCF